MKKTAILFAAVGFGLAGSLSGCASDEDFTAQQYVAEGEVVSLSVDVSDRAVKLMPSEDGKLRIDYYESEKTSYDISLSEEGALSVTLDLDQSWTDFVGVQPAAEYRTVCVYLPQELTDVSVSTTNEAISATGTIAAQNVSMSVNGGDLSFGKIAAEKSVTLNAKNGNITGTILGSYDDYAIACNVKKGESSLPENKTGGSKTLSVDCNNGDVAVEIANA